MTTTSFVEVDVRPILRSGGEPFAQIMQAVEALKPGEGLRLLATFKPTPLFHVLGAKGFMNESREIGGGDWEVLFSPSAAAQERGAVANGHTKTDDASAWPEPAQYMDNRDLDPPEPMVRILEAMERLAPGDVLSALLCREPMFLFPELAKRGHSWRGGFDADGTTYRVLVRAKAAAEGVA